MKTAQVLMSTNDYSFSLDAISVIPGNASVIFICIISSRLDVAFQNKPNPEKTRDEEEYCC